MDVVAVRLAFIDLETTGPSPQDDRIREIGVVVVGGGTVERWSTLVRVARRKQFNSPEAAPDENQAAPRFQDIAPHLLAILRDRLVVAHNARFDYAFLRAEFQRVGVDFQPDLLCSVMLSRNLYPERDCHDLDALAQQHGLSVSVRHRALPDADLVWQLWQVFERALPLKRFTAAVAKLRAGPVFPLGLDASLIEKLPRSPGAFAFHDERNDIMMVGAANNLRLEVSDYFRIDRASDKALSNAHRVANISWRPTRGPMGARLQAIALRRSLRTSSANSALYTYGFSAAATPAFEIMPLSSCIDDDISESFGLFTSRRKAANALRRLAIKHSLCHCLLGVNSPDVEDCRACPRNVGGKGCVGRVNRAKQLTRIYTQIRKWEKPQWPFPDAIGIRERSDLHLVYRWKYLGTARSDTDLHAILDDPSNDYRFDVDVYRFLRRTLRTLPPSKILTFQARAASTCASVHD